MNEKQKIEGIDNKELYVFIAVIGVVVVLLIFEMFFFKGRSDVEEQNAKVQEKIEEMQSTTVAAEQKTVYHALNDILTMMNEKDYQGLYDRLKDDYKNYYFYEYDTFVEFMTKYAAEKYYPKYGSYYRDGDLYYIMVDFLRAKYTREDLLSQKAVKVDTIVLEELKDGDFKFAMNGFVENISHNSSKTVDGVTFYLQNSLRNTETMKTTVMVVNESDKSVSISTNNIQPEIMGGNSAVVSVTSSIHLEPQEFGTLTIEYYLQYNSDKTLNGVTITGVKFADGTAIEDVYLKK